MSDKPILFSAPMVRALIEGRKTQTRRVLTNIEAIEDGEFHIFNAHGGDYGVLESDVPTVALDYVRFDVGDRLYVREAHYRTDDGDFERVVYAVDEDAVREHLAAVDALPDYFSEELRAKHKRLRPGMHMPRWASRLTLIVTDVRVQRLQEISEEDAESEGIWPLPSGRYYCCLDDEGEVTSKSAITAYAWLWNRINASRGFEWQVNPWVVAVTFEVKHGNIDQIGEDA